MIKPPTDNLQIHGDRRAGSRWFRRRSRRSRSATNWCSEDYTTSHAQWVNASLPVVDHIRRVNRRYADLAHTEAGRTQDPEVRSVGDRRSLRTTLRYQRARVAPPWIREIGRFPESRREGKIEPEVVQNVRGWQHSGFSVDQSVFLPANDEPLIVQRGSQESEEQQVPETPPIPERRRKVRRRPSSET